MKKSLFYSLGFFVLALLSGFAFSVNITSFVVLRNQGEATTQVLFFGFIFLVMFVLSLSQALMWLVHFLKARKINKNQK